MKKAFTLTEALLVLSIIGIIVALTLPTISKLRPDENKIKYLKTYDALCEIIHNLASNTAEYPISDNVNGTQYDYTKFPLANTNATGGPNSRSIAQDHSWSGRIKFCNLIKWHLDNNPNNPNGCGAQQVNFSSLGNNKENYFDNMSNQNYSFTSNNGVEFIVFPEDSNNINNNIFGLNIFVDLNGQNRGDNCFYDRNICQNPDRFYFMVTADGKVHAADPMGKAYIQTRNTPTVKNMEDIINNNNLRYSTWVDSKNLSAGITVNENNIDYHIDIQ